MKKIVEKGGTRNIMSDRLSGESMQYFSCLFIQVQNVDRLFCISFVFEFFLADSETPPRVLLLATTLRPLDALRMLTVWAKVPIYLRN